MISSITVIPIFGVILLNWTFKAYLYLFTSGYRTRRLQLFSWIFSRNWKCVWKHFRKVYGPSSDSCKKPDI